MSPRRPSQVDGQCGRGREHHTHTSTRAGVDHVHAVKLPVRSRVCLSTLHEDKGDAGNRVPAACSLVADGRL